MLEIDDFSMLEDTIAVAVGRLHVRYFCHPTKTVVVLITMSTIVNHLPSRTRDRYSNNQIRID